MNDKKMLSINRKSFITVLIILFSFMTLSYVLTFFINKGVYDENFNYSVIAGKGYGFFKYLFAPFRLLGSKDGLTTIMIALFILILGGAFNVMDKTKGIYALIATLIVKFKTKKLLLLYIVTLFFMLFGALLGIFEESITLLPIIIMLALSLGWDTFTGLGMCLMAAGFGFSTALTNPFSVGLASEVMGIKVSDGIGYRIIIFIIMYLVLTTFLRLHIRKIEKKPESSPTYESDQQKIAEFNDNVFEVEDKKVLKAYSILFGNILLIIIATSVFDIFQGLSVPIIAISFLIGSFIVTAAIGVKFKSALKMFWDGIVAMSPAVIMLLLAGSVKFILQDAQILDTVIFHLAKLLEGESPIMGILFIYFIILVVQFFIGSASAKVLMIIPIISVLAKTVGISQNIALLAFVFGDGYTDLIYPTNPVLLIALGMAGFSYTKWVKKTGLLQLIILVVTAGFLILGYHIGY